MARTISVSTDVFATIWAQREPGEDSEDAILRRLLSSGHLLETSKEACTATNSSPIGGFVDARNRVEFPEGFEIFRTYKRREYRAQATSGAWVRIDNGKRYASLNQLNSSIAAGTENVWNGNWKFRAADGSARSIGELRE